MQRLIQDEIKQKLAESILFGNLAKEGGLVKVSVKKGKLDLNWKKLIQPNQTIVFYMETYKCIDMYKNLLFLQFQCVISFSILLFNNSINWISRLKYWKQFNSSINWTPNWMKFNNSIYWKRDSINSIIQFFQFIELFRRNQNFQYFNILNEILNFFQ